MTDLQDKNICPTFDEVGKYVNNPVFVQFCDEIKQTYKCTEKIQYSACSMEPGWNLKFQKGGRTLCTIYPKEGYFTVMVVVGQKEKEAVKEALLDSTARLLEIYNQTKEGNGQRWLMIDLEDQDQLYQDVLRLVAIRKSSSLRRSGA